MSTSRRFLSFDRILVLIVIVVAVIFSAGVFITFFQYIPIESGAIAIDWKKIWPQLEGGTVQYGAGLLMNPPWSALLVAPLGLLPLRVSWGLLAYITTLVLVVSVPRIRNKRLYWLSIALLVLSYPGLRHMIDGNFEVLIIGGALLTVLGYQRRQMLPLAAGLLLLTSKPQAAALTLIVVALTALIEWRTWRRFWLQTAAIIAAVTVPLMLWMGGDWLNAMLNIPERTSIMNMSLLPALERTGLVPGPLAALAWGGLVSATLWVAWRTRPELSREKIAFLLAASLLAAPYSSGNSHITILAVGIIPLFQKRPWLGGLLIALTAFPLFWNDTLRFTFSAWYATLTLLVMWVALGWVIAFSSVREAG